MKNNNSNLLSTQIQPIIRSYARDLKESQDQLDKEYRKQGPLHIPKYYEAHSDLICKVLHQLCNEIINLVSTLCRNKKDLKELEDQLKNLLSPLVKNNIEWLKSRLRLNESISCSLFDTKPLLIKIEYKLNASLNQEISRIYQKQKMIVEANTTWPQKVKIFSKGVIFFGAVITAVWSILSYGADIFHYLLRWI